MDLPRTLCTLSRLFMTKAAGGPTPNLAQMLPSLQSSSYSKRLREPVDRSVENFMKPLPDQSIKRVNSKLRPRFLPKVTENWGVSYWRSGIKVTLANQDNEVVAGGFQQIGNRILSEENEIKDSSLAIH